MKKRREVEGVLDALPGAIAVTLLAALPSFLNLASEQVFEEQKSLLLLAGAAMALPGALLAFWRGEGRIVRDPIVLLFLAYVVLLFVGALAEGLSHDAVFGAHLRRHGLLMWTALAVVFVVICTRARGRDWRQHLVLALIAGSVWPAIYLLIQRLGGDPFQWVSPAAFDPGSTFGNRVLLAGYLALVMPVTMMEALGTHWGWGLLVVLQSAALIASGSRGGMLAAAASAFVFAAIFLARGRPRRTVVGGAVALGAAGLLLIATPPVRSMAMEVFDPAVGSARVRLLIWRDTMSLLASSGSRLWIGHGPESLRRLIPPHYSAEIGALERADGMPDRAHNDVLDTLVNAGVAGAILQLAFAGTAIAAALRLPHGHLRAGLAAALAAHFVELQFGIATVASRLAGLAVVAVIVGMRHEEDAGAAQRRRVLWPVVFAAMAGALSPLISTLPGRLGSLPGTGTADDLVNYVRGTANGTPILYGALLLVAFAIARSTARRGQVARSVWPKAAGLAVGLAAVGPLSLQPSAADTFSSAGAAFESKTQWAEAAVAYREAGRRAPAVAYYRSNLGRALIQQAISRETRAEDRVALFNEADATYRAARTLEPFDPDHSRHLAALFRIRASAAEPPQRAELLADADRVYAEITAMVPALTSLWVEWAYVDLDRQRPEPALEKLDRALALDHDRADARQLRTDVLRSLGRADTR